MHCRVTIKLPREARTWIKRRDIKSRPRPAAYFYPGTSVDHGALDSRGTSWLRQRDKKSQQCESLGSEQWHTHTHIRRRVSTESVWAKLLPSFITVMFLRVSNTRVICRPPRGRPLGIFIRSTPFYPYCRRKWRARRASGQPEERGRSFCANPTWHVTMLVNVGFFLMRWDKSTNVRTGTNSGRSYYYGFQIGIFKCPQIDVFYSSGFSWKNECLLQGEADCENNIRFKFQRISRCILRYLQR